MTNTASRLKLGTAVYDVFGDPSDPEDVGVIYSYQEDGYGVIWANDVRPMYAAADEVAPVPQGF